MLGIKAGDVRASFVVLLVAIPFCAGVAAASGVSLQSGILTALVGGLVVGPLGGARLQVSGPAVSMAALVLPLVQRYGAEGMAAAVLFAGLLQILAGLMGLASLSRLIPAPVVAGAVCAAGLAQAMAQLLMASGHAANGHAAVNLLGLPAALADANLACLLPAALTLVVAAGWSWLPKGWWQLVPGQVAGVMIATLACLAWPGAIKHVGLHALAVPSSVNRSVLSAWHDPTVLAAAFLIAVVASTESLVSAEATIWAAGRPVRLARNRELVAQGIGNTVCGLLGALPLAGAIPRSAANMRAGAVGAGSNILHAVWLLLALASAPWLLGAIPASSLAALLVLGGWRLAWDRTALTATVEGATQLSVFIATLVAALSVNVATGIGCGCLMCLLFAALRAGSAAFQPARRVGSGTGEHSFATADLAGQGG